MLSRFFRRKPQPEPFQSPFPEIQNLVGSKYRVDTEISRRDGLYLATDGQGGRHRIRLINSVDEDLARRLLREAEPCRHLQHPSLAPIRELGRGEHWIWLAREEIVGPTLEEVVENGPQDPARVRDWIEKILDGLEALHRVNIVYDNWQTENLYLLEKDAVLADVGFCEARLRNLQVNSCAQPTTEVHLISPETLKGGPPKPIMDLYSLASAAYMLLAGQPPHGTPKDIMTYLYSVLTVPAPSLKELRPELPAGLIALVDHLLEKDPEKRELSFPDMRRLLQDKSPLRVASRSTAVNQLLQDARADGVDDGTGEFTLNPERALEKLRQFQFPWSFGYLLPLLSSAVGLASRRVRVTPGKSSLCIHFDCPPIPAAELTEIFAAAATRSRRDPMAQLGVGVAGALGAGAKGVELIADAGKITLQDVATPVLEKGGRAGLELRILGAPQQEPMPDLLRERLNWYPVPLHWGPELVSAGDLDHGLRSIPGMEEPPRGWGTLEASAPGLYLRADGLSFRLSSEIGIPRAAVVLDGPWKLDLSYQGVVSEIPKEHKERAESWVFTEALEAMVEGELDRARAPVYQTLLWRCPDEERLDRLHNRIVNEADDLPGRYRYPLFENTEWARRDWDKLVETSCRWVRQRRLMAFGKACRLLTHPMYLRHQFDKDWTLLTSLALDAYPGREERYWRYLLHAWIGFPDVTPALEDVPDLLRHLYLAGDHFSWEKTVKARLVELARKHESRLPELSEQWKACLPQRRFEEARRWCDHPTLDAG